MFNYENLKEEYYRLAERAENNVRKDKLKAPKAPPVYEGAHDISLAHRDVYTILATSHYESRQEFIDALKNLFDSSAENSKAFDGQKYLKARRKCLENLIAEHQKKEVYKIN